MSRRDRAPICPQQLAATGQFLVPSSLHSSTATCVSASILASDRSRSCAVLSHSRESRHMVAERSSSSQAPKPQSAEQSQHHYHTPPASLGGAEPCTALFGRGGPMP